MLPLQTVAAQLTAAAATQPLERGQESFQVVVCAGYTLHIHFVLGFPVACRRSLPLCCYTPFVLLLLRVAVRPLCTDMPDILVLLLSG